MLVAECGVVKPGLARPVPPVLSVTRRQVARVYAAARSAGAGEGAVVRLVPSGPTVQVCPWGLVQV